VITLQGQLPPIAEVVLVRSGQLAPNQRTQNGCSQAGGLHSVVPRDFHNYYEHFGYHSYSTLQKEMQPRYPDRHSSHCRSHKGVYSFEYDFGRLPWRCGYD